MAVPSGIYTVSAAIAAAENCNWDSILNGAKQVLDKYGGLIKKYCGFLPPSVVAVRIWIETKGNPNVGPTKEGEVGLLQLWPKTQEKYGVTNPYDPEQNIRAGCAHWRSEIEKMKAKFPGYFPSKNFDFWAISQLYTMIGGGATPFLLKTAKVRPGHEYSDLVRWLKLKGEGLAAYASKFGTQSPKLIAWRVMNAGGMTNAAFSIGIGVGSLLLVALGSYLIYRVLKWTV